MVDKLTPEERSKNMGKIRSKDTAPEMIVRRLIHKLGYRYRLHRKDLPGKPDIVFPLRKKVIFVHGCFWHKHKDPNCKIARVPKSRIDYWVPKLETNVLRDKKHQKKLHEQGWEILVIWECQISNLDILRKRIEKFLIKE